MNLAPLAIQQFFGNDGRPLSGGLLFTYISGTTTKRATYTDASGGSSNTNPIVLDFRGQARIWLDQTLTYRFILAPANDTDPPTNPIWSVDDISAGITFASLTRQIVGQILFPRTAAEIAAGVVPVNYFYPEGYVDRYGTNTTPDTTDMTAAIQAALDVAAEYANGGGLVFFRAFTYRTTSVVTYSLTSTNITMRCERGAILHADHNGNAIDWIVVNENFSGHTIEGLTINGPNTFLPAGGYVPPSNGAGINMNRNTTTNIVTAYNNVIRDVTLQGFGYGMNMQAVIGLNVFGGFIEYNQYGVHIDGGQTNANHWFGTHIRYNRKAGIFSSGRTGGSLTNASSNIFHACLIESNIPYPFVSGGTPPGDSVAIYLNDSFEWIFTDCYSENHSASIYLTGGSKRNRLVRHRTSPGGGGTRFEQIILDGAGVDQNQFDVINDAVNLTDVSVVSNDASQLWNRFSGSGLNFIPGSISAVLDYADVAPSQTFSNTTGTGLIRMPSQGFIGNVGAGTAPGQMNGIGTATATLNAKGYGEIRFGSGITGATTITSITGLVPGQFLTLTNLQLSFNLIIQSTALSGNLVLLGGLNANIGTIAGQTITFYVNGAGNAYEVGRNFIVSAGTYTVTNPSTDRALNVTADTLPQGLAVLGTLIADLQSRGILS